MSGSRRRGEARLLLGVPVLAAGALVGLCLSGQPGGGTTSRSSARSSAHPGGPRLASPLAVSPGVAPSPADAQPASAPAAPVTSHDATSPAEDEDRAGCCGTGHDAAEPHVAVGGPALTGRVLDPFGVALASARVEVRGPDGALRAVASSGPDGRFRLEALPPGELLVVARCTGWTDGRSLPVTLARTDARDVGDLRLGEGATLSGRVVDAAGRPVAGARVLVSGERHVLSELDGSFEVSGLAPGEVSLVAQAAGRLPSDPLSCAVAADVRGLELRLREAPRLRGRVLGPDGRALAGARVARFGDLDAAVETDADGAFALEGERAGEPLLVTAPGLAAARVTAGSDLEVRLAAVAPAPGSTARLALRRGDAPAAGVTLLVAPAGAGDADDEERAGVTVVTSDEAGLVWLAPGAFDLALVDAATAHARLDVRSLAASEAAALWELPAAR